MEIVTKESDKAKAYQRIKEAEKLNDIYRKKEPITNLLRKMGNDNVVYLDPQKSNNYNLMT